MKKRIWAIVLVVVLALSLVPVSAAGSLQEEEGAQWITVEGIEGGEILFNSETGEIEDCEITVTSANIPTNINDKNVKSIGYSAFEDCVALKTVHVPRGVERIRGAAFRGCVSLETVEIDANITSLESYIFAECDSLINITIPESVTDIKGGAFSSCVSLTQFTIPESVTSIGNNAFESCYRLKNINIPDGVTNIGSSAFNGCNGLQGTIEIPSGVEVIEPFTFSDCNCIEAIHLPDTVKVIKDGAFRRCNSLESINIPNGILNIGEEAFKGCKKLTEISIPPDCTFNIGYMEFSECANLEYFEIPNTVTEISEWAFMNCGSLQYVSIPETVTSIADNAFAGCATLKTIYYAGSQEKWEKISSDIGEFLSRGITVYCNATGPENPGDIIPPTYMLTFWSNGGTQIQKIIKLSGTVVDLSHHIPEREGYVFSGWYADRELTQKIISVTLTQNTEVYAKWERETPVAYTLTFETNGGSKISPLPVSADTTVNLTQYVPTREGYTFAGWYSDSKLTSAVTSLKLTADATVYAKWLPAQYTLTFETNGGSKITPLPVAADITVDLTKYVPTKEGYAFAGWYADRNLTTQVTALKLAADTTVYAKWLPAQYTLTFETNGGSKINALSVGAGTTVDLTQYVPVRAGYDFAGWYADRKLTTQVIFLKPTADTTVYAKWEKEAPVLLPFLDVTKSDWFYEDVAYVYENGLMNGVGEGLFGPEATTTRAMVVTILYRLEGEPAVTGDTPFTDLVAGQYYLDAVAWASANDIVNGVTSTTFAPNDPITREQMAAILYRYAQYKGMDTTDRGNLGSFADGNTVSPYAVEAMAWANAEGLVNGVENNRLNPTGQAPRSQVAAILHRFCTME